MELILYLRARNWPVAAGYALFIGMMAVGYFYNVTFVQLGLKDLGERVLGLSPMVVAQQMAVLALLTCVTALIVGFTMQRRGWGTRLLRKLQLALAVVLVQTGLTAVSPHISSQPQFLLWIVICSLALGVGVPATFSLTSDLIPVRDRGYVAAVITAAAYFAAAAFPGGWQIEPFSQAMLWIMIPSVIGLGVIVVLASSGRSFVAGWVAELAQNHRRARFGNGRFLRSGNGHVNRRFIGFVALMFGIFFVDSLGFLRIVDTPILVDGAWQAAQQTPRLIIAVTHAAAALVAGVLYTYLDERHLFYWIFGLFALTHLSYTFRVWLLPETTIAALGTPMLYATAVSLYTVVNFALWADYSTPQTISGNTAVGVALSGWTATFLSTALSIRWQNQGMPLEEHLRLVQALALLFLLGMLLFAVIGKPLAANGKRYTR
ncbi:MAG: MFS transporter [Chloroflexota bacterium]